MTRPDHMVALHEAGHAIAAQLVGMPPLSISLSERAFGGELGVAGGFMLFKPSPLDSVERCRDQVYIYLAGEWATAYHNDKSLVLSDMDGTADMSKAKEAIVALCTNAGVSERDRELVTIDELHKAKQRLDNTLPEYWQHIKNLAHVVYSFQMSMDHAFDGVRCGKLANTETHGIELPEVNYG